MKLNCIEIDYSRASLATGGEIAMKFRDTPSFLKRLINNGIRESFIVSTCNRFAIYFLAKDVRDIYHVIPELKLFAEFVQEFASSRAAIHNFLATAAGIKSRIIGEYEILGQIKKHYQIALKEQSLGQNLDMLIREGLSLGREVRRSTRISDHVTSYAALAFNLIKEKFNDLSDLSVLLIGTGKMSELVGNLLSTSKFREVLIASHQYERAISFAKRKGFAPVNMDDLEYLLPRVDVIVAGTHKEIDFPAPQPGGPSCLREQLVVNPKTTLIVDLGIPRNFNPEALNGGNVDHVDLDTLIDFRSKNIDLRKEEIPAVQACIERKLEFIIRSFMERKWSPVYKAYWNKLQGIKDKELDWLMPKLGDMDENQRRLIRKFSHKLIRQISSQPFRHMRKTAHVSHQPAITFDLIKKLHDFDDIRSQEILDLK
ncbi:hypothetical protein QQ020_11665 [Fulvivirgaceae bacterium BMA12]|uniref:Glutamyl-tRNA reductase n=1 Tax=Agaribacillus aureus TaxID=3051825 RepID=A0ABT8L6M4_9BACT|nr:hypothetical protein [Fulvivirgaceae bacterium BMA12]